MSRNIENSLLAICFIILLIVGVLSIPFVGINLKHGVSDKTGVIVKVDKRGIINQTNEIDFRLGGMSNGSGVMAIAPEHFTVESDDVATQLKQYANKGVELNVVVETKMFYNKFSSENNVVK